MAKILQKLSLLDAENRLSLTNVALYVVLVKIAAAPNISLAEIGALFLALLNYAHKRQVNVATAQPAVELELPAAMKTEIDEMKSKINGMAIKLGLTGK